MSRNNVMAGITFSITENRIKKSHLTGFCFEGKTLTTTGGADSDHVVSMYTIDSGVADCKWGRLTYDIDKDEDGSCVFLACASNDRAYEDIFVKEGAWDEKLLVMERMAHVRVADQDDFLLYELEGRYLWLIVAYYGERAKISSIKIMAPGDNFMETFPEVYRERNSFFHRYISIFSTCNNTLQEYIDGSIANLDVEVAPHDLLLLYASWLGIDLKGDFLSDETLRVFMKEAGELLKKKGTVDCVTRISEIVTGQRPQVVERALLSQKSRSSEKNYDKLYGTTDFDVTLVFSNEIDEECRNVLKYILEQFVPARISIRIVALESSGVLDSYIYLDENAYTFENKTGSMDSMITADGSVILE